MPQTARSCTPSLADFYADKAVLITGGLGFIGSSLALRLVELGASVSVLDAMLPEYGGNWFNLAPVEDQVAASIGDIRDVRLVDRLVAKNDIVFHCAAQVSHVKSLTDPYPDIDINIKGTLTLLEACRRHNPDALFIKLGTRGQYGPVESLPATEETPVGPKGLYEFSSHAAEQLTQIYGQLHGIRGVSLRLSNIYGPRAQMQNSRSGVANWFVRMAMDDEEIPVYGNGRIIRDFLFIDDCVEAILRVSASRAALGEVFNVGSGQPSNYLELARTIVEQAGAGSWALREFSEERRIQEPGDFYCSIDKIRSVAGWEPAVGLEEGVRRTIEYYREYGMYYWAQQLIAA